MNAIEGDLSDRVSLFYYFYATAEYFTSLKGN